MEADLTKKIRNAIKEKLIELDAYVDNELPDYIMVMVANKKSKECMESDLSLFLGKNTSSFTSWLLKTLEKMEDEASLELANGSNAVSFEKDYNGCTSVDEGDGVEDEILLDTDVLEDELLSKDLQEEVSVSSKLVHAEEKVLDIYENPKADEPKIKSISKQKTTQDITSINKPSHWTSSNEKSKVEQYDPLNPSVKSIGSMVQVSERKSSVPLSLQANKLLLLKAVDDANKSIVGKQNIDEIYKPTPIKVLSSPLSEDFNRVPSSKRNFVITSDMPSCNFVPRKRLAVEAHDKKLVYHRVRPNLLQIIPQPDIEVCTPKRTFHILSDNDVEMAEVSSGEESLSSDIRSTVSPHFVVTLSGIDENTFKRKLSEDLSELSDSENMAVESPDNSLSTDTPSPNEKPLEKCRFWPSCKNGDKCTYVHPTIPCKAFPNCTFKEKCLFVHPNCKFGSACSRENCPYTHALKSAKVFAVSGSLLSKFQVPSDSPKTALCKFHPYCNNYHCPYIHPKNCRFGYKCRSTTCPFTHPSYPARNKLTWKISA